MSNLDQANFVLNAPYHATTAPLEQLKIGSYTQAGAEGIVTVSTSCELEEY